jgi:hypothetical protein
MRVTYTWDRTDTLQATAEVPDDCPPERISEIGMAIVGDEVPPGVTLVQSADCIFCGSSQNLDWTVEE